MLGSCQRVKKSIKPARLVCKQGKTWRTGKGSATESCGKGANRLVLSQILLHSNKSDLTHTTDRNRRESSDSVENKKEVSVKSVADCCVLLVCAHQPVKASLS